MTLDIRSKIPSRLMKDINRAPRVFERHLDRGARRGAQEVAREERRVVEKAFSTLTQSIGVDRLGPGSYLIGPTVDYAEAVEKGTGPGGFPPIPSLMQWIRVKHIQPNDPTMSVEDLAFAMARSIVIRGTPAQPFAEPTAEKMAPRVLALQRQSLASAMREVRLV